MNAVRKPAPPRPWLHLPNEMRQTLAAVLDDTIAAVVLAVEHEVPQYRAAPDSPIHKALMAGVEVALSQLLRILGTNETALADSSELYVSIGEAEYRSRRPLEDVLRAYRIGATTTWRGFSKAAVAADFSPRDIAALAEACFAYINEIAGASTAGYVRAQAADVSARTRVRVQLVEALLAGDGHTAATAELGRRARWAIPDLAAAVALDGVPETLIDQINDSTAVLAARTEAGDVALVRLPLTSAEHRFLRRKIDEYPAAMGTPQPVTTLASSLTHAQMLERNRAAWDLPTTGLVAAQDHLSPLLLNNDPDLAEQLQADVLAPLLDLAPERSEQLRETLRCWLLHHGARREVAEILAVHPQTVSYRMEQIRSLMGEALEDPERRFAVQVALMFQAPTG